MNIKKSLFTHIIVSIGILSFLSFNTIDHSGKYTYEFTVKSQTEHVEYFDLKIVSYLENSDDEKVMELENVNTPFEKILSSGKHEIYVYGKGGDGTLYSKVQGLVLGKRKGSASGSFKNTILKAGPGGSYKASHIEE